MAAVALSAPAFAQETTPPPAVAKLTLGENLNIELHYLLQVQGNMAETWGAGTADDKEREYYSKDFQVRRSRIILKGQVAENLTFFMETDDIRIGNQGKGTSYAGDSGTWTDSATTEDDSHKHTASDKQGLFTQDAFLSYKVMDEFQVAAGQILLPFMHSNRASGAQIFGVDYNSAIIPLATTTNNWRDTGVEFRGLLMNGLIDYRAGIFQGVQSSFDATDRSKDINPNDSLRYCGRAQINLKDAESEFFYSENYLGKKDIISFGVGIDRQASLVRDDEGELADYMAWTADITV
ncbi:MAG: hypothetical protein MUC95_11065, partial [Spirochaetes bacterium]|nr:hypothetical protein [Spirochaetota bacterium]